MRSVEEQTSGPAAEKPDEWLRRGRRLLLTETAFARCVGATLSGLFITGLIDALGGGPLELGVALAAGHVGSMGMLLANPILNRIGSRKVFCLIALGVVRSLRIVIAALPVLVYVGVDRSSLLWPIVACILVSAVFGMSAEIARRSWISDLVPPQRRGRFFGWRIMIASVTQVVVLLAGGGVLDFFDVSLGRPLAGISLMIGFGAAMGLCGWLLLWRTPEPAMSLPRRRTGLMRSLLLPWARPRFRPLIVVAAANSLATRLCGGFFHLYMLRVLGMGYFWVAAVDIFGELVSLAGAPFYGAWADRAGARRVLTVAMLVKGVFPALWILVAPATWPAAFAVVLLRTFNSAGQISWMRLSLNLSPSRNQAAFLAMYQAMAGAGMAVGALTGGALASLLAPFDLGSIGPIKIVPLHVLFAISAVLRLASVGLLRFIREPRRSLRSAGGGALEGSLPRPGAPED